MNFTKFSARPCVNRKQNRSHPLAIPRWQDQRSDPVEKSLKAVTRCAEWLVYCLSIGWSEKDLDELQSIWWRYHDHNGRLISHQRGR